MVSSGSVTLWIDRLQAGDPDAAQQLWERYFRRLVGLARHKLQGRPRAAADEEDVAQELRQFLPGRRRGPLPATT